MWTYPPESVSHNKRQVIRIRDILPDVQIVDVSLTGRTWDSRRTVSSDVSGKRMPLPLCTSGVEQMPTRPPTVNPIPAVSMATMTCRDIDVALGSSDPDPELGSVTVPVVENVPALKISSPPLPGQSSPVSSQTLAWGDVGDLVVPQSCSGGALPGRSTRGQSVSRIAGFRGIFNVPVGCGSAVSDRDTVADYVG